ncbi:hypothetical protein FRC17_005541 [Serendipita sp. 399]|nr:hypothetical protein FRC17_005541 [Serendipita sp. 399]
MPPRDTGAEYSRDSTDARETVCALYKWTSRVVTESLGDCRKTPRTGRVPPLTAPPSVARLKMAKDLAVMYWNAYWSQWLLFLLALLIMAEMAVSMITMVLSEFSIRVYLASAITAVFTGLFIFPSANQSRETDTQRRQMS